jgi:hypothetical protein
MLQINQAATVLDLEGSICRRKATPDRPFQEQPNYFPFGSHDLLTRHDSADPQPLELERAFNRLVIGEKHGAQAQAAAPRRDMFGIAYAIERCRTVYVEIHPDQGSTEVSAIGRELDRSQRGGVLVRVAHLSGPSESDVTGLLIRPFELASGQTPPARARIVLL